MTWLAVALALPILAAPAPAAETTERGRLVEGVACRSDPTQTYTVYLPSAYTPERAWPMLLVFDPRGRATAAVELFRKAAEEHGWGVLSSSGTRNGPMAPNARAVQALWGELQSRYATDPGRVYLAGFSGGGSLAWEVGRNAPVAGVIASGAPWDPARFDTPFSFASFGAAGSTDFNYRSMKAAHARFRQWGLPERLEIFEGAHSWMPVDLAGEAVAWMELQAMKRGLRARDEAWIAQGLEQDLARAASLEAEGRTLEALRRLEAVIATYEGLGTIDVARRGVERLEGRPETVASLEAEGRWDRYEQEMERRHEKALVALIRAEPPFRIATFRAELRLDELKRRAEATGYEGVVARRVLGALATRTGFSLAGDLLDRGDVARAAVVLTLATDAAPGRALLWYNLACARARSGAKGEALDALETAAGLGFGDRARLASDEDLQSLHADPRFQALLADSAPGPFPPD